MRRPLLGVVLTAAVAGVLVWLFAGSSSTSREPLATAGAQPRHVAPAHHRSAYAGPPGIRFFGGKHVRIHFKHPPRAGLLFDVSTGQVLWAHNPLRRLPIASVTKVMSAIIDVENTTPNTPVRITHEARATTGSKVGELPKGKRVKTEPLLAGMLLPSGNDAAVALADHVAGTDRKFARMMNARAKRMGLGCTHYVSSYGLQPANRSCAADLAALARVAMGKPRIARLVRLEQTHVPFPIKGGKLWLVSTNPLLRMKFSGTIGLKTGSTSQAGSCFIAVVRRYGREYGVVLLNSPNIGDQAEKLVNAAVHQHA